MKDDPKLEHLVMDHEYDGIREYDNPLPSWWSWLWVGSMFFSLLYVGYYHIGIGPSVYEEHEQQLAANIERLVSQLGEVTADNATIMDFMGNEKWMGATRGLFVSNCAQCHATDGGGGIGPNLTDDNFKNVKEPKDIFKVITEGVSGTGMSSWERLSEPQRILLSSYVARLRGTTPARPKETEGGPIAAWSTFVESGPGADEAPDTESEGESGDGAADENAASAS